MASRRDELNAYSFARKRTNASFLKPLPNGSIESAPKPLKAVVPSIVVGVLILVGFGACGIIKPVAPQGWDQVGGNVLVGSKSTTRYVVLDDEDVNGKHHKLLHPVLNLASARLLVDPKKFQVVKVDEEQLDGKIAHGPAIGIPFAPDRLPSVDDVDKPKTWAVCNRPGTGVGSKPQQAVFVLGGKDKKLVEEGQGRLKTPQALYVEDPDGKYYLVDPNGVAFEFDVTLGGKTPMSTGVAERQNEILRQVVFHGSQPQKVTKQWMDTLIKSPIPLTMPNVPGAGARSSTQGVPEQYRTVGQVVQNSSSQKYVVTQTGVERVSNFIANILTSGPNARAVRKDDSGAEMKVPQLATAEIDSTKDEANDEKNFLDPLPFEVRGHKIDNPWPAEDVEMANDFGSQTSGLNSSAKTGVTCNFYTGTSNKYPGSEAFFKNGVPVMGAWVGTDYPGKIPAGSTTYVTPGSGLLYREVKTFDQAAGDGSMFLVTDTGLRYSVPNNNDGGKKAGNAEQKVGLNQAALGYEAARVPSLLEAWSRLLSSGPSLNRQDAEQPQGS
ncbi:type VII secretion protein EccB [Streptomyces sp. NPDC101150]|uniref:type VII secretion protein EccB n=1 Tax=Streptomyces sp. NPDC101150 TaxID=3366114 RepID=UPI00380A7735